MKQNLLIAGGIAALGLALGLFGYAVFALLVSDIDRLAELLSSRLGGTSAFGEIVTGPEGKQARSSDVRLTLGASHLSGTGKHGTSTAQVTFANPHNANIFITDIDVIVTGTTSGTFILDGATTTTRASKLSANNDLIDFRQTYNRPTTSPLSLINSWRLATTTFPEKGVYHANVRLAELSNDASSTASFSPSRTLLGISTFGSGENRYTDASSVFKSMGDVKSWPGVKVGPSEAISFALSQDNYQNGCVQQHSADHPVPCFTATSTYVGFTIDIIVHYVSTSTRDTFPF